MKRLPEGFQYSKEALRCLRIRARRADKRIKELCRKDPALRVRVNKLLQLIKRIDK